MRPSPNRSIDFHVIDLENQKSASQSYKSCLRQLTCKFIKANDNLILSRALWKSKTLILLVLSVYFSHFSISMTAALTIDTTSSWNGSAQLASWGVPNTATFGQTFTAPASSVYLNSFQIYLKKTVVLRLIIKPTFMRGMEPKQLVHQFLQVL